MPVLPTRIGRMGKTAFLEKNCKFWWVRRGFIGKNSKKMRSACLRLGHEPAPPNTSAWHPTALIFLSSIDWIWNLALGISDFQEGGVPMRSGTIIRNHKSGWTLRLHATVPPPRARARPAETPDP